MMTARPVVAAPFIGPLDRSSPEALHRQLYGRLREAVLSGRLAAGTRLPSTRALATELGVSRNTVTGAFLPLLSEGYLEGRVGSGTYVSRSLPENLLNAGPGNGWEGGRRTGGGAEGGEIDDARRGRSRPRGSSGRGKHLRVTSEHFEEWWGYGAFFVVAGSAQIRYVPIVVLWPTRIVLLAGIAGNLAIVVLYLLTRTVGIPFFGPEAGEVEGFGFVDVCATASEVGIAVALGAALLRNVPPQRRRTIVLIVAIGLVSVGHVVHLVLRAT